MISTSLALVLFRLQKYIQKCHKTPGPCRVVRPAFSTVYLLSILWSCLEDTSQGALLCPGWPQVLGRKAQHSRQYTQKSEEGVRGGLAKVSHRWVRPLFRSASNQSPNCPPPDPMTRFSLDPCARISCVSTHTNTQTISICMRSLVPEQSQNIACWEVWREYLFILYVL